MVSFPILSGFSCKKEEKKEKNEDVRVFSSLFFPLIEEIEEEEERKKERDFGLFSFRRRRERKKCNYSPSIFLSKRIKGRGRRRDSHFSIGILKEEK